MIQKTSLAIIVLLFALCGNVFAQKTRYLQVSTNPSTVDLYVGKVLPDFASKPNYTSPAFIPVPEGKDSVIVSFFHPDYADTTINIALAANDTSFIIVALRQTYDDDILVHNQDLLKHRNRRIFGGYLKWASIAPFTISGISAIVSLYNISKAEDHKKAMEKTHFRTEKYERHMEDFKNHKNRAETSKTVSKVFFATGLAFLTAGFVLSF